MTLPIQGILETSLYADDLDAAEAFYGSVIGLQLFSRAGNRHVFFRCGDGMLLIFNAAETLPVHGTRGPGHACFKVSRADFDRTRQALSEAGIEIETDTEWPNGARSIYFRDPAGNNLECAEPALWGLE